MSLFSVMQSAGSGMSAQSVRLNVTASNLANADTVGNSADTVYRPRRAIFSTVLGNELTNSPAAGVTVAKIVESDAEPFRRYQPSHPASDRDGYVWVPNVEVIEEMADMISASRSYQANVEIANTTKELALQTLQMGR